MAAADANGENVSLVDLNTNYPAGQFGDPVHPNDTGYAWMAGQWFNVLMTAATASSSPAASSLPADSPTTVAAGATLDLNGVRTTLGPLNGGGSVLLGGSGGLTVNSGHGSTFSGSISGSGGLTKTGPATLVLSGSDSYGGETIIRGGILEATDPPCYSRRNELDGGGRRDVHLRSVARRGRRCRAWRSWPRRPWRPRRCPNRGPWRC